MTSLQEMRKQVQMMRIRCQTTTKRPRFLLQVKTELCIKYCCIVVYFRKLEGDLLKSQYDIIVTVQSRRSRNGLITDD